MTTTDYKIIKGSVTSEPTNVEHVKCIKMTVIPSESMGFERCVVGLDISFKWNDTTGYDDMNSKILTAINAADAVAQSSEESAIITGLEAI